MTSVERFGLKSSTIAAINSVFSRYPQIKKVLVYGSRAKGNHRPGSDIDLTLIGPNLSHTDLLKITNDLDDLLLPQKIDLSLHHQIESADLLDHIKRVGQVFFGVK
jgi:predicted nucleotidyltransferase